MDVSVFASLIITYAVVQTVVLLLLIRFVDLYEREPLSVLALMALWGAIGATTLSAFGNAGLRGVLPADIENVFGSAIYAPLIEEVAKGFALIAFLVVSVRAAGRFGVPRFEGITDGIVYGAAVGLGFAFTEDILYLLQGAAEGGLRFGLVDYLSRRDFFGLSMLHHAIYTAAFGAGLGLATWSTKRIARVLFPLGGLALAMLLHAMNNGLTRLVLVQKYGLEATDQYVSGLRTVDMQETASSVASVMRVVDFLLVVAFAVLVQMWLRYQRRVITKELAEEAEAGLISKTELDLMPSYWRRSQWYLQLIRTGQWERWRLLKRIHNELVNLALMKDRARRRGLALDDVDRTRELILKLKAQKVVLI